LRANEDDFQSWLRLGESYAQSGRYATALKTLERAQALAPETDWIGAYTIGTVQRDMGLYSQAVDIFSRILVDYPNGKDPLVLTALAGAYLDLGCSEAETGYHMRAEISWCSSLELAHQLASEVSLQAARRVGWKLAYDTLIELGKRRVFLDMGAVQAVLAPLAELLSGRAHEFERHLASAFQIAQVVDELLEGPNGSTVLKMAAATSAYLITLSSDDEDVAANAWAGIAIPLSNAKPFEETDESRKKLESAAVNAVKHALRRDPLNDALWSLYGSLVFATDAKVAQHAYIKAVEINKHVSSSLHSDRDRPTLTIVTE
jgi:superkiller protein 3